MEDGDSEIGLEKNILGECKCKTSDARDVFQPIWIRHHSVLSIITNRKFVERKFNFVLIVGILFWISFFISKIF